MVNRNGAALPYNCARGCSNSVAMTKILRILRPSHQHTALSATLLMITTVMLSRVIGYAREAYIAYAFGAGRQTDTYVAAFTLPDFLNYILAGGAASITFISIYTRFLAEKRDEDAKRTFSIIITVMTAVMIAGTESGACPPFQASSVGSCAEFRSLNRPAPRSPTSHNTGPLLVCSN